MIVCSLYMGIGKYTQQKKKYTLLYFFFVVYCIERQGIITNILIFLFSTSLEEFRISISLQKGGSNHACQNQAFAQLSIPG